MKLCMTFLSKTGETIFKLRARLLLSFLHEGKKILKLSKNKHICLYLSLFHNKDYLHETSFRSYVESPYRKAT
jgi:hypothetical protein